MSIAEFAFRIGRKLGKHALTGRVFCLTERILPLGRIDRSNGLVAFHHPKPIANPHVLIVPTVPVSHLMSGKLSDQDRADLVWDVVQMAQNITRELPQSESWLLVINGGERQDIGQLHAHMMHADTVLTDGSVLGNPMNNLDAWQHLFSEIRQISRDPKVGYSMEIRWVAKNVPVTTIMRSKRTY